VTVVDGNAALAFDERVLSGKVLDVVRALLLEQGRGEEVLTIVSRLVHRNEELERIVVQLRGGRNHHEHISRAQLGLFVVEAARVATDPELAAADAALAAASQPLIDEKNAAEQAAKAEPKARPPRGPREIPAHLAQVPNPIPVTSDDRPCPKCGVERCHLVEETTPVIELKPAEVFVRLDRREKLVCKACDGELARAERADKVVEGGLYGPTLVATLVTDKYDDGLPLHRSRARLLRLGLDMPVSTMADQVRWAAELLEPLWRLSQAQILASEVMHIDATSLPVLVKQLGRTHLGTLWGMVGRTGEERVAAYMYASTAKARGQRRDEALELSGRAPEAFATSLGVPLTRLQRWLRAERRERAAPPGIQFAEVAVVQPEPGRVAVRLEFERSGVRVVVAAPERCPPAWLAELAVALEGQRG
jgi:transposase